METKAILKIDPKSTNPETAQIIYGELMRIHDYEADRHVRLVAKAQTLLTVASIMYASLAIANFGYTQAKICLMAGLALGTISIILLMTILHSKVFSRINPSRMVKSESFAKEPKDVLINLAVSYEKMILERLRPMDNLFIRFDWAIWILYVSTGLVLTAFILELIWSVL